ncbi:RtcB family protein, partial [candidate division WOR-3 bacterium]|nr:RtcB family protein [candidate division WOR-3 bacterium]
MEFVIFNKEKNRIPIKCWLNDIESGAREQAENLSNLPFAFKHIALMPDCHQGFGMPIGGVLATKGVIIPNAVGVDIGCGMRAIKLNVIQFETSLIKELMNEIREVIPVGYKHNDNASMSGIPGLDIELFKAEIIPDEIQSAARQLGTLGGGNHFIEFQVGEDNSLWVMIHSGSRNLGYRVAQHYDGVAKVMNRLWRADVPKRYDLAFLPAGSFDGRKYLMEIDYCVRFAEANRKAMMDKVIGILRKRYLSKFIAKEIDVIHNYVRQENHFGDNVWVHRKGAISARKGEIGIIPGSQGTASYIVVGAGEKESFMSCSHGAGRKMSRSKAKEELDLYKEQYALEMQGVIHSVRSVSQLDEAPGAYKDIDTV